MLNTSDSLLRLDNLTIAIPERELVSGLNLEVLPGDRLAILGRNGSGKSLSLLTMAGLRRADHGTVFIGGEPVTQLQRRSIAQHLALLPQDASHGFPEAALERVMSGRHPHIGRWDWESADDLAIARDALAAMAIAGLEQRDTATLSGGERQRLGLAQVLAQQPAVYLLDEPTNHLDLCHQQIVMQHFAGLAKNGAAIVTSLHDVNLAARFANRFLLLFGDGSWELGNAGDVLTESSLSRLLDVQMRALSGTHEHPYFVAT